MDCQLPAIFIKKSERLTEHQQEKMLTPVRFIMYQITSKILQEDVDND